MLRINIENRTNLTMLAKAYWDGLLPKGKGGEVFYSKDTRGEIDFIYFKNHDYYSLLLREFEQSLINMMNSNAATEWKNLNIILSQATLVDDVDYGFLEHYEISDNEYEQIETDNKILDPTYPLDTFYRDMKRLYYGYQVSWWGSEKNVVINIPIDQKQDNTFNIKPILGLVEKYNLNLCRFDLYRVPSRHVSVIRVFVE